MSKNPVFPGALWDGSSKTRPASGNESGQSALDIYREPDGSDYQQILAEVVSVETLMTQLSGALNMAALALAATSGHAKIPTCAGTPTGVPADGRTGFTSVVYDTTAHKLWIYDGGWKYVAMT